MAIGQETFLDIIAFWGSIGVMIAIAAGIWNIIAIFLVHKKALGGILSKDVTPTKAGAKKYFPTAAKGLSRLKDLLSREKTGEKEEAAAAGLEGAAEKLEAGLRGAERAEETEERQAYTASEREGQFRDAINRIRERMRNLAAEDDRLGAEQAGATGPRAEEIRRRRAAVEEEMRMLWAQLFEIMNSLRKTGDVGENIERDIAGRLTAEVAVVDQAEADTKKEVSLYIGAERMAAAEEADARNVAATAPTQRERDDAKRILRHTEQKLQFLKEIIKEVQAKEKLVVELNEVLKKKQGLTIEIQKIKTSAKAYIRSTGDPYAEVQKLIQLEKKTGVREGPKLFAAFGRMEAVTDELKKFGTEEERLKRERLALGTEENRIMAGIIEREGKLRELRGKVAQLEKLIKGETIIEEKEFMRSSSGMV